MVVLNYKKLDIPRETVLMPETIIEQNQNISKYIDMLRLPYSDSIRTHMVNIASGIINS